MTMPFARRAAALALAALTAAAACGAPPPPPVHMVRVTPQTTHLMLGEWRGPFVPVDPGGRGGEAVLRVTEVEGTLMRGTIEWFRDGQLWDSRPVTAALAQGGAGHYNFLSSHAMMHAQGPETFIEVTTYLKDGRRYRHHLARTDIALERAGEMGAHGG
ncbi:hypothetical protein [Oceanicella actignis]|uniref:DUF1579 domain-containing protein n=1 Tax=Oceanicella actignis TaxID=1189325 RepID=A0A1M7RYK0_9RHOB|nr:hypothetical protein [Oceanicella actignis]SES97028.1 hypothetical protein SAMN04488119_102205 [Oceanicella actignis]SHN51281.1 hypothetical protein SAMN05216200_101313 [Oceanicella actignis]